MKVIELTLLNLFNEQYNKYSLYASVIFSYSLSLILLAKYHLATPSFELMYIIKFSITFLDLLNLLLSINLLYLGIIIFNRALILLILQKSIILKLSEPL